VDAANRANALAGATDVLLVLALAGAGLTTYLYLANSNEHDPNGTRVSTSIEQSGRRLQLQGHF
jgi:hypothetical protein